MSEQTESAIQSLSHFTLRSFDQLMRYEDGRTPLYLTEEQYNAIRDLVAQASAAPEQEAAGYFSFCQDKKKWVQQKLKGPEFSHLLTPLYTRPAPPDAEQIRSYELTVDANEVLRQQVAEAQALLRESRPAVAYESDRGDATGDDYRNTLRGIDAFLSGTAQPAETESPMAKVAEALRSKAEAEWDQHPSNKKPAEEQTDE